MISLMDNQKAFPISISTTQSQWKSLFDCLLHFMKFEIYHDKWLYSAFPKSIFIRHFRTFGFTSLLCCFYCYWDTSLFSLCCCCCCTNSEFLGCLAVLLFDFVIRFTGSVTLFLCCYHHHSSLNIKFGCWVSRDFLYQISRIKVKSIIIDMEKLIFVDDDFVDVRNSEIEIRGKENVIEVKLYLMRFSLCWIKKNAFNLSS